MTRSLFFAGLLLLAGCTPETQTAAFQPATAPVSDPEVRINLVRGPSNKAGRALKDELGAALARRGIKVVDRRDRGVVQLDGRMASLNEGNVTTYTWEWRMTRADVPLGRPIVGFERVAGGSSNQWGGLQGANAGRIAERVARKVAMRLGKSR